MSNGQYLNFKLQKYATYHWHVFSHHTRIVINSNEYLCGGYNTKINEKKLENKNKMKNEK